MGAIFGCFGSPASAGEQLRRMAGALSRRSSGAAEIVVYAQGGLGHRQSRKSDASSDVRSSPGKERGIRVVLDGAIYNAPRLRLELRNEGCELQTQTNEELIGKLYEKSGKDCIRSLRGRFAVAIWDDRAQQLVLARDHVGHKPLFYAQNEHGLYFASEFRALVAAGAVPFVIDAESLSHFLSFRFVPAPHSLVKGVCKLPAAHVLVHGRGKTDVQRYWALSFEKKLGIPEDEIVDALEEKLRETIAAHLIGDARTGSFLSAGLDSGLIVATLAAILGKPFHTFSLGVDNESDEIPAARLVARKFNTVQHEAYPKDDVVRLLPAMIWHLDEPSDMVVVSKYLVAKLAAPHVGSSLSGDGGDELFAGFKRYMGIRDAQYFGYVPSPVRNGLIAPLARSFGGRRSLTGLAGKVLWLTEVTRAGGLAERYAEAVEYLRFRKEDKRELFTDSAWREVSQIDSNRILIDKVLQSDADDPVEKLLSVDYVTRLPEHLLMLDDRTGAAHGIDVPCPLADRELAEFGAALPANLKIRGRQAKYIERELAKRSLHSEIINYEKTGWSFPFSELCAGALQPFLRSVFSASRLVEDGIFRAGYIEKIVAEHQAGLVDHHIRIWMLLSIEIWYRMTADGLHYEDLTPWMERHFAGS